MIHLYTGDGKGKTTAAVGLCVRAAGQGMRVAFAQFMKGNDTGEIHALEQLPGVKIFRSDRDFGFYRSMTDEQKRELTEIHDRILDALLREMAEGNCDIMVLDEITYPVKWGLLNEKKLDALLVSGKNNPEESIAEENGREQLPEIVMTGRNPSPQMLEIADYITEMKMLRHPYERGVSARRGIEY